MELQTFIKKPIVIGNLLILLFFVLFPYFSFSINGYAGISKTGMGLFFTIFDKFNFGNFILLLIPIASGNILFQTWKKSDQLVMVSKVVLLVILAYLFLQIGFLAEKASVSYIGIGLWLSLIVSIAMLFETKINEMIDPKKPEDNSPME